MVSVAACGKLALLNSDPLL